MAISALFPASANIICRHGKDILFLKRSKNVKTWPNFWAFPGGKVDEWEFFREAALRELEEEVGIVSHIEKISEETIVMMKTNQGIKIHYFGVIDDWDGMPEILESNLISDLAWHPESELPTPIAPHHKYALAALKNNKKYVEIDLTV